MTRLFGAQRMVLQAVNDLRKNTAGYISEAQIAQSTQISPSDIRDWIETLEGEGFVEVARTTAGLSVLLTAKGRIQLSLYQPIPPPPVGPEGSGAAEPVQSPPADSPLSPSVGPATAPSATEAVDRYQVVLLIHGIRTQADWGPMVRSKLEVPGQIEVIPIKYGYFDAFRFWFPLWTRNKPIERVYKQIRVALQRYRRDHPEAKMSIIAHSFGTYVVGEILKREFDLKIHRLILCGSVLPQNFPWEQYQGRFDEDKVINECGKADIWPVLAQSASWGYGASGTHGFGAVLVKDRFHEGGHGQYFEPEFVEKYWEPFIRTGEYEGTEYEKRMPPTPWWLLILAIFPIQWTFTMLMFGLISWLIFSPGHISFGPVGGSEFPPSLQMAAPETNARMALEYVSGNQPIIIKNLTGQRLRLWYYPNINGTDSQGWRSYDIIDSEAGIDKFPVGWCYIRIQCLTDSETTSLTRIYKKPNDVGWKEFDKTDKPINLVITGQFCSDNAGFGDTPCTVSIEYLK